MSSSKDKRTKGQILRLLDNALTQEELLAEKIKALETELAGCRKKAADPRHELTEEAMPASKVSFRIDYYRTSDKSPLKGIIEHLPSRQNKSFEGVGQLIINQFMNRFLTEETGKDKKKKITAGGKETAPVPVESGKKARVPEVMVAFEETATSGTRLLQRLRSEYLPQNQAVSQMLELMQASKPVMEPIPAQEARGMQEPVLREETPPTMQPAITPVENKIKAQMSSERQSSLLERIREAHRQKA